MAALAALLAFAAILPSSVLAEPIDTDADIDFILDILQKDYAGYETKTTDGRDAEFREEVAVARNRARDNPAARLWAYAAMLRWFGDDHLGIRSKIVSPDNPWPDAYSEKRDEHYSPPLAEDFAFERLSDNTVMLRVPNFNLDNMEVFDALLNRHHETIIATPNLLIDLRGNSGGSDLMYERLMSYLYTRPIYSIGVELRATERNLDVLRANVESGEYPPEAESFVRNLIERAQASDAPWVPLSENGFEITTYPQIYTMPKRVAILAEGAASSGDQFAIDARFSRKVTLLGGPTAGVIDYSNVITAPAPSGDFDLAWPMTRSMRLPEEPFDNIGVQPDVAYPEGVTDQVQWAKDWLENFAD